MSKRSHEQMNGNGTSTPKEVTISEYMYVLYCQRDFPFTSQGQQRADDIYFHSLTRLEQVYVHTIIYLTPSTTELTDFHSCSSGVTCLFGVPGAQKSELQSHRQR